MDVRKFRTGSWRGGRSLAAVGVLAAAVLVAAGCGSDDSDDSSNGDSGGSKPAAAAAEWLQSNADYANTRVASSSTIDADNVDELKIAWTTPLTGQGPFGAFASTPLIDSDGITYVQDLASNVFAYDLATGEQKWAKKYDAPTIGPNGLAYEDGTVYGVTNADVFALDAKTGEEKWKQNILKYEFGVSEGQNLGFTIQPAVKDGVLYLTEAAKAGGGDILALDAADGTQKWKFDTTKEPEGDNTPAGGGWNTPALDDEGSVYFNVANGYYSHNTPKKFQNERLYTNSSLKLDAATGELDWYHQALTNDFWDWDLHLSPILTKADDKDVVIASGKLGIVLALDRETGEQVWRTPVGEHNGHDEDSKDQLAGTLKLPTPPFEVLPGPYGGVETNMAVQDNTVYAAVVNLPGHVKTAADLNKPVLDVDFAEGSGEIVALDLDTGEIKWDQKLKSMPLGAMTVSNDLVFTTTFDGKVRAFSTEDGTEVWSGDLGGATNSPLAIVGDTLVTAAGFPQGKGQKAQLVVYKLNAKPVTPPTPTTSEETTKGDDTATAGDAAQGEDDAALGTVLELGVKEGELRFDKDSLTAPAGKVTFRFDNTDSIPHNIAVMQDGTTLGESKLVSNDTVELTVDLKAGDYEFYCTPHLSAGMKGTLTIT